MRPPDHDSRGEERGPEHPIARAGSSRHGGVRLDNGPEATRATAPHGGSPWPADKPVNHSIPDRVPTRPQGDRPVIAHLVWDTHEELIPGRAIRWTATHVMVMIKPLTGPPHQHELIAWLPAHDVYATIPRRRKPGTSPVA